MKISECIQRIDDLRPNGYGDDQKTQWLSELDGKIQAVVLHLPVEEMRAYTFPEDSERELLARYPHDRMYPLYLAAMIDFANGEYSKYQNSMAMFNDAYGEYAKWYLRTRGAAPGGTSGSVDYDRIQRMIEAAVGAAVESAVSAAVSAEIQRVLPAAIYAGVVDEVKRQLPGAIPPVVKTEVGNMLPPAVRAEVRTEVSEKVPREVALAVPRAVSEKVEAALPAAVSAAVDGKFQSVATLPADPDPEIIYLVQEATT